MDSGVASMDALEQKIHQMVNAQMETDAYKHILGIKYSPERYQVYVKERSHFVMNRRNCWAYVQANAPFDVKKLVWEHELDELAGNKERGVEDHVTLGIQEAEVVGLTPADFETAQPADVTAACCEAWLRLASSSPWLEALAASAGLEMINSDEVVKGGGFIHRLAVKLEKDAGIPVTKQASNKEHMEVDIEHPKMLMRVARKYALDAGSQAEILRGLTRSLQIDRVWRDGLASEMEKASA